MTITVNISWELYNNQEKKTQEEALRILKENLEWFMQSRTKNLAEANNFIEAIIDTAGPLIVVLDNIGIIICFNTACVCASSYPATKPINRYLWKLLLPPNIHLIKLILPRDAAWAQDWRLPGHYSQIIEL